MLFGKILKSRLLNKFRQSNYKRNLMKTVKVSIQDQNTLVLQEDASKGDLIDLTSIHETDIDKSTITSVVKSIKMDKFNAELEKEKESITREKNLELKLKEQEIIKREQANIAKKDQEIVVLNSKLDSIAEQTKSKVKLEAIEEKQKNEKEYRQKLNDKDLEINNIKHKLQSSETALISLKEMRSRMSTKMIGESLELHCENEFNKIRSIAFPNAEFEKDNQIAGGTKVDYIYREHDDDGNEILSIMFEMKNEDATTATKHKNRDFFKKLDKDRKEKQCEYAVLVSLLEKDNEFYDDIVTVHEFQNMYSIRPQHFITIIGFLRQGNLKSQELRREIQTLNNQNVDVSNFQSKVDAFKDAFGRNYDLAHRQFDTAINEIDKTIDHLSKIKENLLKSDNNLRLANNKATDLSIKRLTIDSPSVATAIENQSSKNT